MKYPVGRPSIGAQESAAVASAFRHGWITQGPAVQKFEEAFARLVGTRHAVACSSGTSALHLALVAHGLGPGDEVLVPDLSYVATANAVSYTGARPVLVDINTFNWGMDTDSLRRRITRRSRAIVPVHLYGMPCDMSAILDLAREHDLIVIEDAAEGLGASCNGIRCGAIGDAGTFSFYANKILTTGEGGMVVTNSSRTDELLRSLRGQAQSPTQRFYHSRVGYNYRMTDLQASIGIVQIQRMSSMIHDRFRVVDFYEKNLGDVLEFHTVPYSTPWLFTALLPEGVQYTAVAEKLAKDEIEVRPVFVPMHRLPMYQEPDNWYPISSLVADRGISLPTWPELTQHDLSFICQKVKEAL